MRLGLILAALGLPAGRAQADCSLDDGVATCSGDLSPGVIFDDILSLTVTDLTSDIRTVEELEGLAVFNEAEKGEGTAGPSVAFSGGSFGILSTRSALVSLAQGGEGEKGEDKTRVAGDADADKGKPGGFAGNAAASVESGFMTGQANTAMNFLVAPLLQVETAGGVGGQGGKAETGGLGHARGGDGAVGGDAGGATLSIEAGSFLQEGLGDLLLVRTIGGDGGDGGEGRGDAAANGSGGKGGDGGFAGNLALALNGGSYTVGTEGGAAILAQAIGGAAGAGGKGESRVGGDGDGGKGGLGGFSGDVTVTSEGPGILVKTTSTSRVQHGLRFESLAGAGGDGGEGKSSIAGNGRGGDGGVGGGAGKLSIQVMGDISTVGPQSQGLFARSYGGAGGAGGKGSATIGNGRGGAGSGSGPSGPASVSFQGTISTLGDEANALIAQSVGGFSGNAGAGSGFVAYGSGSQSAGNAANVTVSLLDQSKLTTSGTAATALLAQSIGGGGGRGSAGDGVGALGGDGSAGGDGAAVTVSLDQATIETAGQGARALHLGSRGGGGGSGGAAGGIVSLGGSAGTGGTGGSVQLSGAATLQTRGDQADALYAASLGGGGGSAHTDGAFLTSIGGRGGDGGDGGTVTVDVSGAVATLGDDADGLFLQSVGGGGGDGSNAIVVSDLLATAIGGRGGTGGQGGGVRFSDGGQAGEIKTSGERARGLFAQSVGGGGGDGGYSVAVSANPGISFALGASGAGGSGGDGGAVSVESAAAVSTEGANASALTAQSTGGGGGSGGFSVSANAGLLPTTLAIGGRGGDGGDGGAVAVAVTGQQVTKGDLSAGVLAQSQGGGGGHSGMTVTGTDIGLASFGLSLGGAGGDGGSGGAVTLSGQGSTATEGHIAPGIYAHSIGGGGGFSGISLDVTGLAEASAESSVGGSGGGGGSGGDLSISLQQTISTKGDVSPGLSAQSIGGGGGHSGLTLSTSGVTDFTGNIALGGRGGEGGDGGKVTVLSDGAVSTLGHASAAISAQSIGGGGGTSHFTGSLSPLSSTSVNLALGGDGGSAGNADDVMVQARGPLATAGDHAPGITAMSLAGGGGEAGIAVSGTVNSGSSTELAIGGSGASGGVAGAVSVSLNGDVTTKGSASTGIRARSVGGSGGHADLSINGTGLSGGEVGMSIGGDGGNGGEAGSVTVNSDGDIATEGATANAIAAQSIGGAGGSGQGSISASGLTIGTMAFTAGGAGGVGGKASAVSVSADGALSTESQHAHGILAQSLGGNGGNGGFAVEAGLTGGKVSGALGLSVGGAGGTSGSSETVTVDASGSIATGDFAAMGILAQSIGGNGGSGGNVYTGNAAVSQTGSLQLEIDIGGSGGGGATSEAVTVTSTADITTGGFVSDAVLAQSIGGNGGNGGSSYAVLGSVSQSSSGTVGVAVGGQGGSGAKAGAVAIDNSGRIETAKGGSSGLRAQSVGGGGGDGGSAAIMDLSLANGADENSRFNAELNLSIGGAGGSGNDGGDTAVTNSGDVTTKGAAARALVAQSVGGGGGEGGASSSLSIGFDGACRLRNATNVYSCTSGEEPEKSTQISASLSLAVGGSGGASGDGGSVSVTNSGALTSSGEVSHAIVAQSIGAGGGAGGEGGLGLQGWTTNSVANQIANTGQTFTALPSFTSISAAVGGSGGASGDGGAISLANSGAITTSGRRAHGIFAQTVGGGGGIGALGSSGLWSVLTLGGLGSGGGDGGDATVDNQAPITTTGTGATALWVQSVGGGGGLAGDVEKAFTAPWLDLNIGVGVGVQLEAGGGGDGGDIQVTSGGRISTSGTRAHGLVLQSVGGSGGAAGISGLASGVSIDNFAGSIGDGGKGGDITLVTSAPIEVTGRHAHGLFAQSVGGKGEDDDGGAISITLGSSLIASGTGGRALLAQSSSGGGSKGKITITIEEGATVATAADGWETIGLFDGQDNLIVNRGQLLKEGGNSAEGFVVRTNGTAALSLVNEGFLQGSIRAGVLPSAATNGAAAVTPGAPITIDNLPNATYALGSDTRLGQGGSISNAGRLSPGGDGVIATSALRGDLIQTSSGTLFVDFDLGGGNDLILARNAANSSVGGRVVPNPLGGLAASGASGVFPIFRAQDDFLTSAEVASTATVDYRLEKRPISNGETALRLGYAVDLTPWDGDATARAKVSERLSDRIGARHDALGVYLDALFSSTPGQQSLFLQDLNRFLLTTEDASDLVDIYDRFAPAEIFAPSDAALFSSLRFADDLNSCPAYGPEGQVVFTQQGSCYWLQVNGGGIDRQRQGNSIDYDESFIGISLGGQMAVGDGVFLGGAFGYEDSSLSNARVSGDGSRFQAGIVAKKEIAATTISGSFSGGVGIYDLSRQVITPGGRVTASSSPNVNWVSGHAQVSHLVDLNEAIYVKPWFDLGLDHQWQGAFSETGAGAYGLEVDSFSQTLVTVNPAVELGNDLQLFGAEAKLSASAGLLAIVSGRDRATSVRLRGAAGFGPSYQVNDEARPLFADIGANLEVRVHERAVISLGGQALLSGNQQEYGGTGRISIFF
ncbi:MAG: hypothetical protein AAFY02_00680 [Pseudomonadota bacterium]